MKKQSKIINLYGDKKVQNTEMRYAEVLRKFIEPFALDFLDIESFEDIFDLAIYAWNFGNLKSILPEEEFNKTTDLIHQDEVDMLLLNKMIDYKVAEFKEHTNFIVDFEVDETNDDLTLTVTTETEEEYFTNMIDSFDDEINDNNFEESFINRNAIVLKPLQPFIDWHNTIYPNSPIDYSDFEEPNIYLINDDIDDLEGWLTKNFDRFFMMELEGWHLDEKEWPQKRNYKMFKLWFQVEVSTMIYDVERRPILKLE